MTNTKHKIIVAVTGASGSIYAKVLFDKLQKLSNQIEEIGVIMSDNAKFVWETELGNTDYNKLPYTFYEKQDFMAPFASGSANYNTMILCPCSMGTLGRISSSWLGTNSNGCDDKTLLVSFASSMVRVMSGTLERLLGEVDVLKAAQEKFGIMKMC